MAKIENDNIILGENLDRITDEIIDEEESQYKNKRSKLKDLKIQKHTWNISELYQKILDKVVNLDPDYQREEVWKPLNQSQFIESLFMGIIIPPIYLAEVKPKTILDRITYEVVDGKQRLISIKKFFDNELVLTKGLQYYGDLFSGKKFKEISKKYPDLTDNVISSVIDLYVITQNVDPEIKYDVFARLNQGNIKLTQAELRKAIFSSELTLAIRDCVNALDSNPLYKKVFSPVDKRSFKNLNRIYQSVAYIDRYREAKKEDNISYSGYNSRPKDMINKVLQKYQTSPEDRNIILEEIPRIAEMTYQLKIDLNSQDIRAIEKENKLPLTTEYTINGLIPFYDYLEDSEKRSNIIKDIYNNDEFLDTFKKSQSTTSAVDKRLNIINNYVSANT